MPVTSEEHAFAHYNSLVIHYESDICRHDFVRADAFIKLFLQSTQRRPAIILDLSQCNGCSDSLFREMIDHAMNASLGMPVKPRLMMASSQRELNKIYDNLTDDVAEITFRPTIPNAHADVAFVQMMGKTKAI